MPASSWSRSCPEGQWQMRGANASVRQKRREKEKTEKELGGDREDESCGELGDSALGMPSMPEGRKGHLWGRCGGLEGEALSPTLGARHTSLRRWGPRVLGACLEGGVGDKAFCSSNTHLLSFSSTPLLPPSPTDGSTTKTNLSSATTATVRTRMLPPWRYTWLRTRWNTPRSTPAPSAAGPTPRWVFAALGGSRSGHASQGVAPPDLTGAAPWAVVFLPVGLRVLQTLSPPLSRRSSRCRRRTWWSTCGNTTSLTHSSRWFRHKPRPLSSSSTSSRRVGGQQGALLETLTNPTLPPSAPLTWLLTRLQSITRTSASLSAPAPSKWSTSPAPRETSTQGAESLLCIACAQGHRLCSGPPRATVSGLSSCNSLFWPCNPVHGSPLNNSLSQGGAPSVQQPAW